jgi:hypothetical protein
MQGSTTAAVILFLTLLLDEVFFKCLLVVVLFVTFSDSVEDGDKTGFVVTVTSMDTLDINVSTTVFIIILSMQ